MKENRYSYLCIDSINARCFCVVFKDFKSLIGLKLLGFRNYTFNHIHCRHLHWKCHLSDEPKNSSRITPFSEKAAPPSENSPNLLLPGDRSFITAGCFTALTRRLEAVASRSNFLRGCSTGNTRRRFLGSFERACQQMALGEWIAKFQTLVEIFWQMSKNYTNLTMPVVKSVSYTVFFKFLGRLTF